MKIAVTYENGQVFQHFGHSKQVKVYETEDGKIVKEEILDTSGSGHSALAGFLKANGIDTLICGGIGGGAKAALAEAGIQLYPGVAGDADGQVQAFLEGRLVFNPLTECAHHAHGQSNCRSHGQEHACQGNCHGR